MVSDFEINTLDIPIEPIDFADREYHAIVTSAMMVKSLLLLCFFVFI